MERGKKKRLDDRDRGVRYHASWGIGVREIRRGTERGGPGEGCQKSSRGGRELLALIEEGN